MNESFKYKCTRRPGGRLAQAIKEIVFSGEEPFGAGSGGDPQDGGTTRYLEGMYTITAGRIQLGTVDPAPGSFGTTLPGAHEIDLVADDGAGVDGRVGIRGTTGVRITTGPPKQPPFDPAHTEGVEVAVGEEHSIVLNRGMIPGGQQGIAIMSHDVNIVGTTANVSITSLAQITLEVAGGVSSITLTPSGIVMKGPLIQIN